MSCESMVVGNKPAVAGNAIGQKIYRPYSIVNDPKNSGRTRIDWFCAEREEPIGQYEQLIEGYERGGIYQIYQEAGVNECFTETEIKMLREYLKRDCDMGLRSIKRTLPIPNNIMPHFGFGGLMLKINAQGELFLVETLKNNGYQGYLGYNFLFQRKDYDLPFAVFGYVHQI
jgi:hypothetical protein